MPRVLGVDPGIEGGLAIVESDPASRIIVVHAIDVPSSGEDAARRVNGGLVMEWIVGLKPDFAVIENVNAFPEQGVSSSFRFGRAAGALETAVQCSRVPYDLVAPAVWKRYFRLSGPDKEPSRQMAIQRFPRAVELFKLKKHHQRAEAALLALYWIETQAHRSAA